MTLFREAGNLSHGAGHVAALLSTSRVDIMRKNSQGLALTIILTACLVVWHGSFLYGQNSSGTISGTVSDSQGARLADTKIIVTNTGTGVSTTSSTNADGAYTVGSLPIGSYSVEARRDGFKTSVQESIVLTVGQEATVHFSLTVGKVDEIVEVSADVPIVETNTSSFGWLVGESQVRDLPLNGRNFVQLTLLTPGVQPVPQENTEGAATLVPFGFGSPQRFSVAGGRPQGQLFLIDGTDTAGVWGNGTGANLVGTTLGVDGIAEFQVLSNTYTAEYGGNGAVVNAAIRSGTNEYHGSAYEFARNSAMDAKNYFDPGSSALPFSRNQFGGTFGGPIRKNKTFFFGNYEGLKQDLTVPVTTIVPDQNFRDGFLPCSQTIGLTCDPTTGLADVGINPGIASYLNAYPIPNGAPATPGTADNVSALSQPLHENYGIVRVDHNLSQSDSLFGSYEIDAAKLTALPNPVITDDDTQRNQYLTVEERKVISPSFLNVAHFAYVRSNIDVQTRNRPDLLVVPGADIQGTIGVAGLNSIGGNDSANEIVNRFTFRDQIAWTRGRHAITAGLEVVRHYIHADIPIVNGGNVVYNGTYFDPLTGINVEPAFQSFLQNQPLAFVGVPTDANDSTRNMRHTNLSPYIQDKFQLSRNFVLNLGLRYDFETNPVERDGKLYNLIHPATDTGFTHVSQAFAHNVTKWNFEPRIGFAWDIFGNGKTSVRGGFGAFADMPLEMQVIIGYLFNPPIYNVTEILFPTIPNPFGSGIVTGLPGGGQQTDYSPKMNDYIMQYNLNVQQEVFGHAVLTAGYIGSRANHLFIGQETNPCVPTSILADGTIVRAYGPNAVLCSQAQMTNPNLSNIVDRFAVGTSNYNSMQVALERGFGKNIQFRTAYTWSKCLDYGSYYTGNDSIGPNGQTAGLQAGNLANSHSNVDYGPCDFDLRNNWTSNLVLQLPFQGNRLKEGWQLGVITSVHSGTPYSVYDAFDRADVGANGAAANAERPDLVPGRSNNPTGITKSSAGVFGFDPGAFQPQPIGVFGDLGRNTLVAAGVRDIDFSVAKATRITERTSAQLRLDIFNLANHTNFGFPNAALYIGQDGSGNVTPNGAAGQITSTATTSRQIQLSAKFIF